MHTEERGSRKWKQKMEAESVMMQRDKLAARPSLNNRGSGRTNVLAARASWLLVQGRLEGPCPFGTSESEQELARSREGESACLQARQQAGEKGRKGQCKKVNANADECKH